MQSPQVSWFQAVWFPGATPKYSVLTWIAVHDRLATGVRVQKWSLNSDSHCVLCTSHIETREHLFFFLSVFSANMERINKESATVSLYRGLEWHPESSGGKWKKQNGYVPSKICFSMLCSYHMVGEK